MDRDVMLMRLSMVALLLVAAAAAVSACEGPCESLAKRICDCRSVTPAEAGRCKRSFIELQPRDFTDDQEEECDRLLELCDCDDLTLGRRSECGLANKITGVAGAEQSEE